VAQVVPEKRQIHKEKVTRDLPLFMNTECSEMMPIMATYKHDITQ